MRRFEPLRDFRIGKAQASMRMLFAEEFQPVRRKIDDGQTGTRTQNPGRLGYGRGGVGGEVKHLVKRHRVPAAA